MITTVTLAELIDRHGIDVLDHLDRSVDVPIVTGPQAQGDIIVLPQTRGKGRVGQPVPTEGIPVVRGENGGNTHTLLADGPGVTWTEASADPDLGVVMVPSGSTAYLAHPEHAYAGIGPGRYLIRRQVQQDEMIRMVQD